MNLANRVLGAAALSYAGRYSLLWMASAAFGWLFGNDRAGFFVFLLAIVGEWILTNGPVKLLFRRERPDSSGIAHLIPSWLHPPRSSSFPSGHSSAAAFATIIWWAWSPVTGIVCAVFAIAMGASRIVIKAHHPSDVAAGFAWGAALAGLCLAVARDSFPS